MQVVGFREVSGCDCNPRRPGSALLLPNTATPTRLRGLDHCQSPRAGRSGPAALASGDPCAPGSSEPPARRRGSEFHAKLLRGVKEPPALPNQARHPAQQFAAAARQDSPRSPRPIPRCVPRDPGLAYSRRNARPPADRIGALGPWRRRRPRLPCTAQANPARPVRPRRCRGEDGARAGGTSRKIPTIPVSRPRSPSGSRPGRGTDPPPGDSPPAPPSPSPHAVGRRRRRRDRRRSRRPRLRQEAVREWRQGELPRARRTAPPSAPRRRWVPAPLPRACPLPPRR